MKRAGGSMIRLPGAVQRRSAGRSKRAVGEGEGEGKDVLTDAFGRA